MKIFRRIVAISLLFLSVFVSCKNNAKSGNTPKPETAKEIVLTISCDANASVSPSTLKAEKGSRWSDVKSKITLTPNKGWKLKAWNLQKKDNSLGIELKDSHIFNENSKIYASTEKIKDEISLTISCDSHASVSPATLTIEKGSTWGVAKGQITLTPNKGWKLKAWNLQNEDNSLGIELKNSHIFNKNAKVYASTEKIKDEISLTISCDSHASVSPATLTIEKGSTWGVAKGQITLTPNKGWKLKAWNLQNEDNSLGIELNGSHIFNENAKVYASTQEIKDAISLTIGCDANATVSPKSLTIEKGSVWKDVKTQITLTPNKGFKLKAWNLQNKDNSLGIELNDSHIFNENTKIYASTEKIIETFKITITQPDNGVISVKKIENSTETPLDASHLDAIPEETEIKIELKALDSTKYVPSILNIDNDKYTTVSNGVITHTFKIKKDISISGILTAFFKITKNDVENGAISITRDHQGSIIPVLDSELSKILDGKELIISLSANSNFLPKSLSIKEEKKSVPELITDVDSNGKITKKIIVRDNITISGEVEADPNVNPATKMEVNIDGIKFNMVSISALTTPSKLCAQEGVTLDAYEISDTEVTQELYKKIMNSNPTTAQPAPDIADEDKTLCPVSQVTWYQAVSFCNELTIKTTGMSEADCVYYSNEEKTQVYRKADGDAKKYPYVDWSKKGFRLPTEAEWEAAALARETKKYPGSDDLGTVAWHDTMGYETILHKVGTKTPNAFGIFDMAGNVAEWVWDPYKTNNDRKKHPINKNPTFKPEKEGVSCKGRGTVRGGEYVGNYTTIQYECTERGELSSPQDFDSIGDISTGIRLGRGAVSIVYEKVKVEKITLRTYEMRKVDMEKAESSEGFEKVFFPFTDTVKITVASEDDSNVTYSENPVNLTEEAKEVIITVTKEGKGERKYTLRLKKAGRLDNDTTNGEKKTYTAGDTGITLDMISIASIHDVWLGAIDKTNNQPHKVSLSKYQISSTEVTQKLYQAITGENPSFFVEKYKVTGDVQELRPVDQVNWYAAIAFCNMLTEKVKGNKDECVYYDDEACTIVYTMDNAKRDKQTINQQSGTFPKTPYVKWEKKGFRLPTEAEWEWAAYGGEYGRYAGSNKLVDVAWCGRNSTTVSGEKVTREVAKKEANGYGIFDMAGNVYEWCGEWWDNKTPEGGSNPIGCQIPKTKNKATRSSSYGLSELNEHRFEDAERDYNSVFTEHKTCGIRLVCKLF